MNASYRRFRRYRNAGYTLTELAIVVSIMGILTAIVVPAFSGYLKRTRLNGSRNQLIGDLYYARSLAIANRRTFTVQFEDGRYNIVDTGDSSVVRTIEAPDGVTFTASDDANFYAWGLADAIDVTLSDGNAETLVNLLPTGTVDHD
jgi:prepilin-type N-terminal cleavage/methylation domain-containing protein